MIAKSIFLGRQALPVGTMRNVQLFICALFATFTIFFLARQVPHVETGEKTPLVVTESASEDGGNSSVPKARIAKVSMAFGDDQMYARALENHRRHAERWGYPMYALRRDALGGFRNKPAWMLSLVVQELAKPPEDRVDWIFWADGDSLIINPSIPLEIFLPPPDLDDIHMISTKDHNGFNSGIMFLRVHPWTVAFLTETSAYPLCRPEEDLGAYYDQEAMSRLLRRTDGPPTGQGYADQAVYMPRLWINPYETIHGFEGEKGDILVHFPGLFQYREERMEKWFSELERHQEDWEVPLEETKYQDRTTTFWNSIREARNAFKAALEAVAQEPEGTPIDARREALINLRNAVRFEAHHPEELHKAMDALNAAIAKDAQDAQSQNRQTQNQQGQGPQGQNQQNQDQQSPDQQGEGPQSQTE